MKLDELTHLKTRHLISISLVFGVFFAFFIPFSLDLVVFAGKNIPKPETELLTDYFIGTIWALALGSTIFFWPVSWTDKKMLFVGWFFKVCVSLGVLLIYEYKYQIDGIGYFYFSPINVDKIPFTGLFSLGVGSEVPINEIGTWNMVKLVSIHNLFLPKSYHAMKVTYSMFGLVGIYIYYRAALVWLNVNDKRYFYLLLFLPSLLFWNSLIGKESVFLLLSGVYCYGVVGFYKFKKYKYLVIAFVGVYCTMHVRMWVGLIFVPPLIFFGLVGQQKKLVKIVTILILIFVSLFVFKQVLKRFNYATAQDLTVFATRSSQSQHSHMGKSYVSGGAKVYSSVQEVLADSVKNIPTALFRPLPGEVRNLFGILAGLENLAFVILFVRAFKRTKLKELKDPLILWAIAICFIWGGLYGFINKNLGTFVRWKVQILPIYLGLLLYLGRRRQNKPQSTSQNIPVTAG